MGSSTLLFSKSSSATMNSKAKYPVKATFNQVWPSLFALSQELNGIQCTITTFPKVIVKKLSESQIERLSNPKRKLGENCKLKKKSRKFVITSDSDESLPDLECVGNVSFSESEDEVLATHVSPNKLFPKEIDFPQQKQIEKNIAKPEANSDVVSRKPFSNVDEEVLRKIKGLKEGDLSGKSDETLLQTYLKAPLPSSIKLTPNVNKNENSSINKSPNALNVSNNVPIMPKRSINFTEVFENAQRKLAKSSEEMIQANKSKSRRSSLLDISKEVLSTDNPTETNSGNKSTSHIIKHSTSPAPVHTPEITTAATTATSLRNVKLESRRSNVIIKPIPDQEGSKKRKVSAMQEVIDARLQNVSIPSVVSVPSKVPAASMVAAKVVKSTVDIGVMTADWKKVEESNLLVSQPLQTVICSKDGKIDEKVLSLKSVQDKSSVSHILNSIMIKLKKHKNEVEKEQDIEIKKLKKKYESKIESIELDIENFYKVDMELLETSGQSIDEDLQLKIENLVKLNEKSDSEEITEKLTKEVSQQPHAQTLSGSSSNQPSHVQKICPITSPFPSLPFPDTSRNLLANKAAVSKPLGGISKDASSSVSTSNNEKAINKTMAATSVITYGQARIPDTSKSNNTQTNRAKPAAVPMAITHSATVAKAGTFNIIAEASVSRFGMKNIPQPVEAKTLASTDTKANSSVILKKTDRRCISLRCPRTLADGDFHSACISHRTCITPKLQLIPCDDCQKTLDKSISLWKSGLQRLYTPWARNLKSLNAARRRKKDFNNSLFQNPRHPFIELWAASPVIPSKTLSGQESQQLIEQEDPDVWILDESSSTSSVSQILQNVNSATEPLVSSININDHLQKADLSKSAFSDSEEEIGLPATAEATQENKKNQVQPAMKVAARPSRTYTNLKNMEVPVAPQPPSIQLGSRKIPAVSSQPSQFGGTYTTSQRQSRVAPPNVVILPSTNRQLTPNSNANHFQNQSTVVSNNCSQASAANFSTSVSMANPIIGSLIMTPSNNLNSARTIPIVPINQQHQVVNQVTQVRQTQQIYQQVGQSHFQQVGQTQFQHVTQPQFQQIGHQLQQMGQSKIQQVGQSQMQQMGSSSIQQGGQSQMQQLGQTNFHQSQSHLQQGQQPHLQQMGQPQLQQVGQAQIQIGQQLNISYPAQGNVYLQNLSVGNEQSKDSSPVLLQIMNRPRDAAPSTASTTQNFHAVAPAIRNPNVFIAPAKSLQTSNSASSTNLDAYAAADDTEVQCCFLCGKKASIVCCGPFVYCSQKCKELDLERHHQECKAKN